MLYINGTNNAHCRWHVSVEPQLALFQKVNRTNDFADVISVQADGDELTHIYSLFTNIPTVKRNVVIWFGETAKFIAANLY